MEVVSFTPQPIYFHGKSPQYSLDKRLSGKNLSFLPGIESRLNG
jgi:hypothetical protein